MTAPTPEKMLALAELGADAETGSDPIANGWIQDAAETLRAAADALAAVTAERDQAREALAATNKLGAFETGKTIGAAEVRTERDQARQLLADAPHQYMVCQTYNGAKCTCWKAGL